jgi:hypothetical protein
VESAHSADATVNPGVDHARSIMTQAGGLAAAGLIAAALS